MLNLDAAHAQLVQDVLDLHLNHKAGAKSTSATAKDLLDSHTSPFQFTTCDMWVTWVKKSGPIQGRSPT